MDIAKTSVDRRSTRTRATLQQALISLIAKKRYEAITIKDICNTANVGRSTFYAHYSSKDDLKRSGLESLRCLLVDRQRRAFSARGDMTHRTLSFTLAMFEHARDHRHIYQALAGGRGGAIALGQIRKMLCDLVRDELAATADDSSSDSLPREIVVQYLVGAYMAVLTWWLDDDAKLPVQSVDVMFRRLAMEGVAPPPRA